MKINTVFFGVLLACLCAACAQAITMENIISLLRPDYFQLDGWLAYNTQAVETITTLVMTTTTTTTMPVFTFGNQTLNFNVSWCANITQLNADDYAFLYQGRKIDLNASDVQAIQQADVLSQNCTRVIRARTDMEFIQVCNNSNPTHVWGVNCKYGNAKCISYGSQCGSMTTDQYWHGCERVD